jgi:hypothetical protein
VVVALFRSEKTLRSCNEDAIKDEKSRGECWDHLSEGQDRPQKIQNNRPVCQAEVQVRVSHCETQWSG